MNYIHSSYIQLENIVRLKKPGCGIYNTMLIHVNSKHYTFLWIHICTVKV